MRAKLLKKRALVIEKNEEKVAKIRKKLEKNKLKKERRKQARLEKKRDKIELKKKKDTQAANAKERRRHILEKVRSAKKVFRKEQMRKYNLRNADVKRQQMREYYSRNADLKRQQRVKKYHEHKGTWNQFRYFGKKNYRLQKDAVLPTIFNLSTINENSTPEQIRNGSHRMMGAIE